MTNYANIPEELKSCRQWVVHNSKIPHSPKTGHRASVTDPKTWASFEEACEAVTNYDGLGFVFTAKDSFVGVDFDHCVQDGQLDSWVSQQLSVLDSYTEYSPSGTGLHVICKGSLPAAAKSKRAEIYDCGRFFTITGNVYGLPRPVRSAESGLTSLYEELKPPKEKQPDSAAQPDRKPVPLTDDELLEKARTAQNGERFKALFAGDLSEYDGDHSRADIALCNLLAYWCNGEIDRMDRLFRQSELMRPKWDRPQSGSTYGRIQLEKAVAEMREGYEPEAYHQQQIAQDFSELPAEQKKTPLSLICAENVEYVPPRWLIEPYFQRGKGTLIQADPGTGKTAFMCAVAAHVTTGESLMSLPVETPGTVLMLSVEDDLGVLRGRIDKNGGDLRKVFFMSNTAGLTIESPDLERAIQQIGARLLILDPFQAFLGAKIDMHRANETRPALAKLFDMCDRHDCACAIIAHMSKNTMGKSPVNQSLGSVDIPAAMRSVLHIVKNPKDDNELLAVHVKSSNAPRGATIAYNIVDRGGVEWCSFSDFTAEDLSIVRKRVEKGVPYDREPLVRVFKQLITERPSGGFWSYSEVKSIGSKLLGFPPFTTTADLKAKLDGPFARELQENEGLIVTAGEKSKGNIRGIRVERYIMPEDEESPQEWMG